jgi:hypothetical protein
LFTDRGALFSPLPCLLSRADLFSLFLPPPFLSCRPFFISLLPVPPPHSGYARLALEVLNKAQQDRKSKSSAGGIVSSLFGHNSNEQERVVLVATTDKWSHSDYGINERDMLVEGRDNIGEELKKIGGANLVICLSSSSFSSSVSPLTFPPRLSAVDQPRTNFTSVLDGVRYGADVTLLSPGENANFNLPLGFALSLLSFLYLN